MRRMILHPEGMPEAASPKEIFDPSRTPSGCEIIFGLRTGGLRCARPPATFWQSSGLEPHCLLPVCPLSPSHLLTCSLSKEKNLEPPQSAATKLADGKQLDFEDEGRVGRD